MIYMDKPWSKLWIGGFLISAFLVLMSTSKTSLLGLMLAIGILVFFNWMRENRLISIVTLWLMLAGVIAAVLLVLTAPDLLVAVLGRDLTLTGRTDIWAALLYVSEDNSTLGFGYGAFWELQSDPAFRVREITEWPVPTAHNGIMEVYLALGRVGVAVLVIDYLLNLYRSLTTIHFRRTSLFCFGFFSVFALFSISESVALAQNSILWIMYCTFAVKLGLDMRSNASVTAKKRFVPKGIMIKQESSFALRGRLK